MWTTRWTWHGWRVRMSFAALVVILSLARDAVRSRPQLATRNPQSLRPELALQIGHSADVSAVAFSPDGTLLASGSDDGTVKLWNPQTGDMLRTLTGHEAVRSVGFSADGKLLACASGDTVRLWDAQNAELRRTLRQGKNRLANSVAFSPDGTTLACGNSILERSVVTSGEVQLWDVEKGKPRMTLRRHAGSVNSVAFSPDESMLASASGREVQLWDAEKGRLRWTLTLRGLIFSGATAVAFSLDSKTLVSGGEHGEVILSNAQTGEVQRTLGGNGQVHSIAFAPDGETLVVGHRSAVRVWNAQTATLQQTLEVNNASVALSPDGKTLAIGGQLETIELRDTKTGALTRTLTGHAGRVYAVAFSPDGSMLASGTAPYFPYTHNDMLGEVRLWDVQRGAMRHALQHSLGVWSVAFSPDGKTAAGGSRRAEEDGSLSGEVKVWDARTGMLKRTLKHNEWVFAVTFSPDGQTLASGCYDNTVRLWDTETGDLKRTLKSHSGNVFSVVFSPDGQTLASASWDRTVKLWDAETGELKRTLTGHGDEVYGVAFSPDGKILVSGGGTLLPSSAGEVKVWDAQTGELKRTLTLPGGWVYSVAFAPDGKTLASGHADNTVRLWDVHTGALLRTLTGHSERVNSVAFAPDGKTLVSGSYDNTVRLWNVQDERLLATLLTLPSEDGRDGSRTPPLWMMVTPEGYYHCSHGTDDLVKWRFANNRLVPFADFEETFRRPDVVRKALRGEPITEQPLLLTRVSPACKFVSPKPNETVTGDVIRVLIEATDDQDVKELRLYVNGVPLPESTARPIIAHARPIIAHARDVPAAHRVSRLFTTDVPLPAGEKDVLIRAVVYDGERNKSDTAVTLHRANVTPVLGDLHLLCVGVSQYRNPNYNAGVTFAAKDAEAIATAMRTQQGKQYAHVHATVLTDERATVAAVREALRSLAAAKPPDTVMVFLSGHGVQSEGKFYFAPHGIVVNDIEGTCLSWQEVVETLSGIYAKKILFTDACHSGTKLGARQATSGQLAEATRQTGIVMLASSQGDEFSFEQKELGHGAFTVALLEAFRGASDLNRDGVVTLPELEIYVPKRVSEMTQGLQHPHLVSVQDFNPQTPLVKVR